MPAVPSPSLNPTVQLLMSLDTFNQMQAVLAKQPFEEISELIFFFRNQVQEQINQHQQRQVEQQTQQAGMVPRLHMADVNKDLAS